MLKGATQCGAFLSLLKPAPLQRTTCRCSPWAGLPRRCLQALGRVALQSAPGQSRSRFCRLEKRRLWVAGHKSWGREGSRQSL